jgi:hypothetical protein
MVCIGEARSGPKARSVAQSLVLGTNPQPRTSVACVNLDQSRSQFRKTFTMTPSVQQRCSQPPRPTRFSPLARPTQVAEVLLDFPDRERDLRPFKGQLFGPRALGRWPRSPGRELFKLTGARHQNRRWALLPNLLPNSVGWAGIGTPPARAAGLLRGRQPIARSDSDELKRSSVKFVLVHNATHSTMW